MRGYVVLPMMIGLLALFAACWGEVPAAAVVDGIPPCTPVEGSDRDPCAPTIVENGAGSGFASTTRLGDEPTSMRRYLDGSSDISVSHIVLRGTYLPGTVRCEGSERSRHAPYTSLDSLGWMGIACFVDVRVNQYIVGTGPSHLTLVYATWVGTWEPEELEAGERAWEDVLEHGGLAGPLDIRGGGIVGNEEMMFIGPSRHFNFEAMQVFTTWDVERRGNTVVAVHPQAERWLRIDADRWRSRVERPLLTFGTLASAAALERSNDNGGRIRPGSSYPQLVTNAAQLHDYYVETGAINHAEGSPSAPPSVYCGLARGEDALLADCEALLGARDTLRGTGTLNWGMDTAIGSWDGITAGGTPQRVTKVELPSESLTGSIPAGLGDLTGLTHLDLSSNSLTGSIPVELELLHNLVSLKLSGNSLTGCIPMALRNVTINDLDTLDLLDCAE